MIGKYIKEQRLIREITLRQLCRISGIDASNYSKFELGKIRSVENLEQVVAYIFKITDEDDYKLWYTAIAASRQKDNPVYDRIVRDCLNQWDEMQAKKAGVLRKHWVARAVLSTEKASELLKYSGVPAPPPPPPPRVITERKLTTH
jgi:transcriptional regulator with XRE-family HTH domain